MTSGDSAEYVLRQVRDSGVKFIGLWFADLAGRLKSVSITAEQLESALADGIPVDGGTLFGAVRRRETDLLLVADPSTFAILPWRADSHVARMFCDLVAADGAWWPHDPRGVLKRMLGRAAEEGYSFYVGCEVENYYFADGPQPLVLPDAGGYFDATPSDAIIDMRRETVLAMEQLGVAVESTHHEVGPGQFEVKLQYTDPLSMADGLMTYRQAARQLAMRRGLIASFMPKPLQDHHGSGLHVTISVLDGGQDAFTDRADPDGLSPLARSFVAGLLEHAPALSLVTNRSVNSYKRLAPGFEAPSACTWARRNWDDLVRVPTTSAEHEGTGFIEYRAPDAACNPYLAFAALLAAGLDGVRRQATPPPLRDEDTPAAGAGPPLPRTLAEAVTRAAASELLPEALGGPLVETLLTLAQGEWEAYHGHVSAWEIARYYPDL